MVGCDYKSDSGELLSPERIDNQPVHDFGISCGESWDVRDGTQVDRNPFRFFSATGGDWGRMGPQEDQIQ